MSREYQHLQAEDTHGMIIDVLVDVEAFDDEPSAYFVPGSYQGEIETKGVVAMEGADYLPDILTNQ